MTITATDGSGATTSEAFTWTVLNPAPIATDDDLSVNENGSLTGNIVTGDHGHGADFDPDGDPISVSQVAGSAGQVGTPVTGSNGGLFTINPDGSYTFTTEQTLMI